MTDLPHHGKGILFERTNPAPQVYMCFVGFLLRRMSDFLEGAILIIMAQTFELPAYLEFQLHPETKLLIQDNISNFCTL